jgi:hypothetical protein
VLRKRQQVAALETDRPAGDPARWLDEADDGQGGDRFAAARFADESECFAGLNRETDVVNGGGGSASQIEDRGETLDGK